MNETLIRILCDADARNSFPNLMTVSENISLAELTQMYVQIIQKELGVV